MFPLGRRCGIQSKQIHFNVRHIEKGEKTTISIEILFELDLTTPSVKAIFDTIKPNEPVKEKLSNVITKNDREQFKLYYWGDVCI